MPATPSAITPDVVAALNHNDEGALERLFRDQYETLATEAAAVLEDPPSAAGAVERAFLSMWDERASFKTPEDLEAYLHKAVHSAALRQKGRRAALHHGLNRDQKSPGGSGGRPRSTDAPSVDAVWTQMTAKLHPTAEHLEASAREVAAITRHDASEHMSAMARPTGGRNRLAGLAVGVVIVLAAAWWIERVSARSAGDAALSSADAHLLQSPPGKLADVTLLDGSVVKLAPGTTLKVPSTFPEKIRVLRLDGAATFKVDPTPPMAFDLRTANAAITATGTLFTVRAYPSESEVTIRVTEGSVSVKSSKETRSLTAGGVLAVEKDGTMRVPDSASVDESMGWTSGYLTIRSQPLRQVLQAFDLWYGVHLVPTDSAILTRTVSMHASLDSVSKAIAAVESSANVRFAYDGPRLTLSDRAASKKK